MKAKSAVDPPTHIAADSDARTALCGARDGPHPHTPYVLAAHVQMHIDGRNVKLCISCRVKWELTL